MDKSNYFFPTMHFNILNACGHDQLPLEKYISKVKIILFANLGQCHRLNVPVRVVASPTTDAMTFSSFYQQP